MQYSIYKEFYPEVEKKINRIAKKAAKYGNPFTFKIVDEVVREIADIENNYTNYYPFVIIELDGEAKVGEYECVAVLEMHESGNLIRRINEVIDIPDRFLHSENVCEHCNTKRNRKNLFVVYSSETNEFKQVGSDCLQLYTHGMNPKYIASFYDCITELEEFDGKLVGGYGKPLYRVSEVLGYAEEIINKMGYFNSSSDLPTRRLVSMMFERSKLSDTIEELNRELLRNRFLEVEFSKQDFYKEETEQRVKDITDYYLSLTDTSEFTHNVQVLLKEGYTSWEYFGYLCYLPEGYNRHIKKEIAEAQQRKIDEKSEYFGEVGKRYKSQNVFDVYILTSWDSIYGYTYMYKIVLESGNILIWKSTKWYSEDELLKVCKIDFTVKEHSEFRGTKQTTVTRCNLILGETKKDTPAPAPWNDEADKAIDEFLNMCNN